MIGFAIGDKGYFALGEKGAPPEFKDLWEYGLPASVRENNAAFTVSVFPSPAKEQLCIVLSGTQAGHKNITAEIFSMEGQLLQSVPFQSPRTELKTGSLASGMYLVKIKNPEGMTVRKFAKE